MSLLYLAFLLLAPVISVGVERLGLDVVDLVSDLLAIVVFFSVRQSGGAMGQPLGSSKTCNVQSKIVSLRERIRVFQSRAFH